MAARLALVLATCSTFTASAATGEGCAASDANLVDLRNTLCQSIGSFPGFPDCASPGIHLWPYKTLNLPLFWGLFMADLFPGVGKLGPGGSSAPHPGQ
jgi:hypothetical protein